MPALSGSASASFTVSQCQPDNGAILPFLGSFLTIIQGTCLLHARVPSTHKSKKESCMYEVLNEVYLQNFYVDSITFRDESNHGN